MTDRQTEAGRDEDRQRVRQTERQTERIRTFYAIRPLLHLKRCKHNKPYNTMHTQYSSCGRWDFANEQSPSEIQRDRQTDRDRHTDRDRKRETEIETERQTDRQTEKETDRHRDREGESKQTRSCLLLLLVSLLFLFLLLLSLLLLSLFITPSHPRSSHQNDTLEHTKQD